MANIRSRETANGPRYDVKFTFNGKHRMKTFRTLDDARSYKKRIEGEQLAGLRPPLTAAYCGVPTLPHTESSLCQDPNFGA